MVKRERERETAEDIKQAFRVFDKVRWCRVTCRAANEPSVKFSQSWRMEKTKLLTAG